MDKFTFILLVLVFFPLIKICDKKGMVLFYVVGLGFYFLDHVANAIKNTFGD